MARTRGRFTALGCRLGGRTCKGTRVAAGKRALYLPFVNCTYLSYLGTRGRGTIGPECGREIYYYPSRNISLASRRVS